jgi:spore germination protein GerM
MTAPAPWRAVVLAALALAGLVGGCGLSEDGGPQAIAPENLPPDLLNPNPNSSTTLPGSPNTTSVTVYFIERIGDRDHLAAAEREVADARLPGGRLEALFSQPTAAEGDKGLTTSIPADTVLLDVTFDDAAKELDVNLSNEIFSIQGEELAKAFAQIVWTVTEPDDVARVRFLVDGTAIRAPDAEGVEQDGAVNRLDYAALAPVTPP